MLSFSFRLSSALRPLVGAGLVLATMFCVTSGLSAARLGLIVGSNYKGNGAGIPPLDLCEADAKLMEKTIKSHGRFDHVEVLLGRMVSASRMEQAVEALAKKAGPNDTVGAVFRRSRNLPA